MSIRRRIFKKVKSKTLKKKIAKKLRKSAEKQTIGKGVFVTRKLYVKIKKAWKENHRVKVNPKIKMTRRQQRIHAVNQ